uniref:F-box associated beta-propeller type 1 domain-containing protein n=1 Tax=Kalanchoe fedtschenkoi TaxID=63787 RepID=A0A7N0UMS4_KALFE
MVFDSYDADNKEVYKFVLWNPSTRAFRELVKPPGPLLGHFPDKIPIYGFGYDLATDDYKIIRAVSDDDGTTSTYLEIYSLKDNAWRQIQASLPCVLTANYWGRIEHYFPGIKTRGSGVHTNGAVHWLESRNVDTPDESDLILSFNLASEKFEEVIPLPDYDKEYSSPGPPNFQDRPCRNWMTSDREIWVMEEYGVKGSWTMILTMPADPGPEFQDSFIGDWFIPFSYCCGNGCLLMDMNGCEVLIYDPKRKTFSKIELGENRHLFLVQEFVDTLVSPHLSSECTGC